MGDAKALLQFLMSWTCTTPAELHYCRSITSLVLTSLSTQIHRDTPWCHDALLLEMQSDDSALPSLPMMYPSNTHLLETGRCLVNGDGKNNGGEVAAQLAALYAGK